MVIFLACLLYLPGILAQEATPEKLKLIKEIIKITQVRQQVQEYINQILLAQDEQFAQILARTKFPDEASRNDLMERRRRFSQRFKELLQAKLNIQELIDKVYIPLYDKYFNEAELQDLLTFYSSSTGRKTLSVTPQLYRESMQRSQFILGPIVHEIINQIITEEQVEEKPVEEQEPLQ